MKNMLKKIGVIGIIVAMLSPFFEMPVVKAAETCSDHTVMQYYFLDVTNGNAWEHYNDGYKTYTVFKYLFPEEAGKQIKILDAQLLTLTKDASSTSNTISIDGFYGDIERLKQSARESKPYIDESDDNDLKITGNYETIDKSDYKVVKILHGKWGKDNNGAADAVTATWDNIPERDEFKSHTVQSVFDNDYSTISKNITISKAQYKSSKFSTYSVGETNMKEYFTDLTNSDRNKDFINDSGDSKYFAIGITRKIDSNILNKYAFGQKCSANNTNCSTSGWYLLSQNEDNVSNSYDALRGTNKKIIEVADKSAAQSKAESDTAGKKLIITDESYYWPAVLNVEYEVCTNTSEQWTLKYDGNTDDDSATGVPSSRTENVGTAIPVDEKTPTRNGYVFKGWNTERNGSGDDYTGGQSFSSPKSADVKILFAQWGDASKGDQKKTGVVSYVIGFISVGIVASGIYLIAKKKNLFRQI